MYFFNGSIYCERVMAMIYKIRWTTNKYRRDQRSGALQPVKRSAYANYLFGIGAGWKKTSK